MTRPTYRLCALAAAATTALAGGAAVGVAPAAAAPGDAKNIILLIGDGMGRTHITAARERFYGAHSRLNMEKAPNVGQVSTFASQKGSNLPALVTDSASAATAWSSGVKTYNAALGVDAYERRVATLMEQAKKAGMRTGNVSTAEITDATPAGMMSHALLRGCQGPTYSDAACLPPGETAPLDKTLITPIAEQIARNGTADVIFGGGLARFEPSDAKALRAQGYRVLGDFGDSSLPEGGQTAQSQRVATRTNLNNLTGADRKVIGLFNRGNMTVERSKAAAPAGAAVKAEPTLAEMTTKAVSLLGNVSASSPAKGKGFFLQVEGALIDKRSHANDAAQTLDEMKAFDDAVKVAYDFAARDGNTLVIVTADHECAGFNIIEPGTFTNAEATTPPVNVDSSNPANNSTPSRPTAGSKDPARSSGPVNGSGSGDPKNFGPATFRTADDAAGVKDGSTEASLWLTYLSGNHTGQDVTLFAMGPRSGQFRNSYDNTDIYQKMFRALAALDGSTPNRQVAPR